MLRHPEVRTASQFGQCTANYVASCDYTLASNAATYRNEETINTDITVYSDYIRKYEPTRKGGS